VVDTRSRSSGDVWYFAYGSNLHPQRRATRAELSPIALAAGTLGGWRLVFDMPGVPPAEPAMASIRRDPTSEVHGLLLRLRAVDFAALIRSEGGDRFYVREQVEVITYDGDEVTAEVFVAAPGRRLQRERAPSRRYLELIREGARLSSLRPEYRAWLDALPHADSRPAEQWASDLFLDVFMRASRGALREVAHGWLAALQRTEELEGWPRRVAQGVLLAPVIGVGLGLRLRDGGRKPRT